MGLRASGIQVTLGGRTILHGVDFEAQPGEITIILGQNGSGKTTLTRVLTGEIKPESGKVRINGEDLASLNVSRLARMRAVLPQSISLSFPFTVREVVRLGVDAGGGTCNPNAAIDACLTKVGLSGYAGRKIHQLSGGEQQRVHLARVLAQVLAEEGESGPRWLFLDEPVSSLDLKHQNAVMQAARAFANEGGGVVAVLHDLNLAAAYADKIVMLAGGKLIATGSPPDVMIPERLATCYQIGIATGMINNRQVFVTV